MARVAVFAVSALLSVFASTALAAPMDVYRGKARPVIVFAPDGSTAYREQIAALQSAAKGIRERDIVVIGVSAKNVSALIGGPSPRARGDILRHSFSVQPDEFRVMLIGKDGGVKFRSGKVVPADELFRLVDGMPMRRDEMRRQ